MPVQFLCLCSKLTENRDFFDVGMLSSSNSPIGVTSFLTIVFLFIFLKGLIQLEDVIRLSLDEESVNTELFIGILKS